MTTYENFTNWLQQEMRERGWDQAELARQSGVTTAQVSRIFTGERKAGADVCRRFARALHLPAEEVFRRAGLLPKGKARSEGADELLHLYGELGDSDRRRLLAIARTLHGMAPGE